MSADAFFGYFLDTWIQEPRSIPADRQFMAEEAPTEVVTSLRSLLLR